MNTSRTLIIIVSLLLFALACYFPAFIVGDETQQKPYEGWFSLILGWLGILLHADMGWSTRLFHVAWFANISYLTSIILLLALKNLKNKEYLFYYSISTTLLLGLLPLLVENPEILINEAGWTRPIEHMSIGYYLWIGSFMVLLIGKVILSLVFKNTSTSANANYFR